MYKDRKESIFDVSKVNLSVNRLKIAAKNLMLFCSLKRNFSKHCEKL